MLVDWMYHWWNLEFRIRGVIIFSNLKISLGQGEIIFEKILDSEYLIKGESQ